MYNVTHGSRMDFTMDSKVIKIETPEFNENVKREKPEQPEHSLNSCVIKSETPVKSVKNPFSLGFIK